MTYIVTGHLPSGHVVVTQVERSFVHPDEPRKILTEVGQVGLVTKEGDLHVLLPASTFSRITCQPASKARVISIGEGTAA